ncbi:hypothetical protein [Nocardioides litoris]|uniref:hypothetical protein n=1 Tax=Nocardioides litoris TaxID=1926648 RepID=UPI001B86C80F|nr:hypothetical protein [Nocardioides litoris]
MTRHWTCAAALDVVTAWRAGGHVEAEAARATRLARLSRGDGVVCYSARTSRGGRPLRAFTALGTVADDAPWRVGADGPWRRTVVFEVAAVVAARPLLPVLAVAGASVEGEERWASPFRRGLVELSAGDFAAIAGAMRDGLDPDAHVIGRAVRDGPP